MADDLLAFEAYLFHGTLVHHREERLQVEGHRPQAVRPAAAGDELELASEQWMAELEPECTGRRRRADEARDEGRFRRLPTPGEMYADVLMTPVYLALRGGGRRRPLVTNVRGALLVVAGRRAGRNETLAFVKASGADVGLKGPETECRRPLPLGNCRQPATDASPSVAWLNVELVDPLVREHKDGDDGTAVVAYPDLSLRKDDLFEPRAHLVFGVNRRGDFRNGRRPRAEPHLGNFTGLNRPGSTGGSDLARETERCLHPGNTTKKPETGR